MKFLTILSVFLQITGFVLFSWFFFKYYSDRKGIYHNVNILKGAKMYKDENGVPNIKAENIEDGYFTLGFAHAEDRLWQMYFGYKIAVGEISELFGEDALVIDKFSRLLNFREICKTSVSLLDENELKLGNAYVNGVNYYIETAEILPLEFTLFKVKDIKWGISNSCLLGKLVEYYLTYDFIQEMMRTYLKEKLKLPIETIEKLYPYHYNHHEYKKTIIKDEENKDLKYKQVTKTLDDIKEIIVDEEIITQVKGKKTVEISQAIKGTATIEDEINAYTDAKEKKVGSNNCVISGKLTKNGHPYLCNDPHLLNGMPSFWYFINMKINEEYHFIEATHPGIPALFIGSNSHVAWGITNGHADTSDILRLYKKGEGDKYIIDNTEHNFKKRTERVYLDTSKQTYKDLEFLDSEYGPILNGYSDSLYIMVGLKPLYDLLEEDKYFYILRSTFTSKVDRNLKSLFNIALSKSIQEIRHNLSDLSISLNVVFIDKTDNIGYQLTGKIPKRNYIGDGTYIKTIKTKQDLYIEHIPFEELPHLLNPERGYIVTSNNIIIDNSYKYILQGSFIMDSRARALEWEIEKAIKTGEKIDSEFIKDKLLNNIHDTYCKDMLSLIHDIISKDKKVSSDLENTPYLKQLFNFDCIMHGDSFDALLFNIFESEIYHLLHYSIELNTDAYKYVGINVLEAEERINYLLYKLKGYLNDPTQCEKEYKMTCGKFLLNAYDVTLKYIKDTLGKDKANQQWKNINIKHYPHKPLSRVPILNIFSHRTAKTNGNWRTPKVSLPRFYKRKYKAIVSSNLKFIVSLYDIKNELYFSIDSWQNGKIFHRHYDDMLLNHEEGKLIKFDSDFNHSFTLELKA